MPGKTFYTATDGATVTFDFDQSACWQVTLGGNRTLTLAGGQEGDEVNILLIQDGSGSRVPVWPSNVTFAAGGAPSLTTAAGGMDLVTLVKRGSTWQDKSGAPSKLPSRIRDAALGTIMGVAVAATVFVVSNNGQGTGRPGAAGFGNLAEYKTGSGSTQVMVGKITASGSPVFGQSGSLVLGSKTLNEKGTDATFYVKPNGNTTAKGYLSGTTIYTNVPAAGLSATDALRIKCIKSTGQEGYAIRTSTGFIQSTCN